MDRADDRQIGLTGSESHAAPSATGGNVPAISGCAGLRPKE